MKVNWKLGFAGVACFSILQVGSATGAGPIGVMETSMGAYEFTPSTCAIYKDGDVYDIEIEGPGRAPDGEILFFEFSSTGNHVGIKLGVDSPFASSERQIQAGQHISTEFAIEVSGEASDHKIVVPTLHLVDGDGQPVDTAASLRIEC